MYSSSFKNSSDSSQASRYEEFWWLLFGLSKNERWSFCFAFVMLTVKSFSRSFHHWSFTSSVPGLTKMVPFFDRLFGMFVACLWLAVTSAFHLESVILLYEWWQELSWHQFLPQELGRPADDRYRLAIYPTFHLTFLDREHALVCPIYALNGYLTHRFHDGNFWTNTWLLLVSIR